MTPALEVYGNDGDKDLLTPEVTDEVMNHGEVEKMGLIV